MALKLREKLNIMKKFKPSLKREKRTVETLDHIIKPSKPLSLTEKLDAIAFAAFGDVGAKVARFFELNRVIAEAGMNIYPALYGARVVFWTYVATVIALIATLFLIYSALPIYVKLVIGLFAGLLPVYVFFIGITYPSSLASMRERAVDHELPFAATYMTALARGGVPIGKIIERLAECKVFEAIREEARRILREVRYFGKDILSAIEYVAARHPNRLFKDFLLGWVSVIRTGGDIAHYLEAKSSTLFEARLSAIRTMAERIALFSEAYVIFAVVGSIGFYVFFAAGSLLGIGGGAAQALISFILFSFIALPLVSAAIIYIIGKLAPPAGAKLERTRKVMLAAGILGLVIAVVVASAGGGISDLLQGTYSARTFYSLLAATTVGLEVFALPTAIVFLSETRGASGLERSLASFLRDLAEVRKTGLSPERSLIYVARRDYGKLTWIVRQVASRLAWGFPLRKSVEAVLTKVKDWFTRAVLTFLVDAIDVGGGSPSVLDALARFTAVLAEIEIELRKRLKPYIVMPYFGAVLTAVSTILVLQFTAQTLAAATNIPASIGFSPQKFWQAATIFSQAVLINSFLMGMVAGKIATRFTEGGFLHAAIITAIVAGVTLGMFMMFRWI